MQISVNPAEFDSWPTDGVEKGMESGTTAEAAGVG